LNSSLVLILIYLYSIISFNSSEKVLEKQKETPFVMEPPISTHPQGATMRPIVSSMNTPTTGIPKFSDKLLRPLFDKYVRSTTIIDGTDLILRLETG
jgi:hypothetical protein